MPDATIYSRGQPPTKSETPGPGTYQAPSDFGYLEFYKTSPSSPKSGRRQANTATILSSRGGARRSSFMSQRNSQGGGSELRHGKRRIKQILSGGLNTPNETIQFSNTMRGPQQFQKYI